MKILGKFEKQPQEQLTYQVDYSEWFSNRTDAPSSFVVTAATGLTVVDATRVGTSIYITVSGGVDQTNYGVSVLLTTDSTPSNTKEANFVVKVKDVA
jgi:hypothetical protein